MASLANHCDAHCTAFDHRPDLDAQEALRQVREVLAEYAASCSPAPYSSERALFERLVTITTPTADETGAAGDAS